MKNDFLEAIGNTTIKGYRAHFKLLNGDMGITAYYTQKTLDTVIEEAKNAGGILIKIEEEPKK